MIVNLKTVEYQFNNLTLGELVIAAKHADFADRYAERLSIIDTNRLIPD